jgi:rfaE bifunctional protein kinase chain/domain
MNIIEKIDFENKKVLIIGEASIDKYIIGTADRISPDAPVPNIKVEQNQSYIGGIGLAIKFIKSLGGIPVIHSVVGNDYEGNFFLKKIDELKLESSGILIDNNINTPQITRIKSMNQHVLRLETDYSLNITESVIKEFYAKIEEGPKEIGSILILNYGIGGLFSDIFIQNLLFKLKKKYENIPILARPDFSNYHVYEEIELIKMNLRKALQNFLIDCCNDTSISIVGKKVLNSTKCNHVLLSYLDSESFLFSKEIEKVKKFSPIIKGPVTNYVSVGSAIMAILALTYASKIPIRESVEISMYGATLSATLPPVDFFNTQELCNYISKHSQNS